MRGEMSLLEEYTEVFKRYEREGPAKLSDDEWDWLLVNEMCAPTVMSWDDQVKPRPQAPVTWIGQTLDAALLKKYAEVYKRYPGGLDEEESKWIRDNAWRTPSMILRNGNGVVRGKAPTRAPVRAPTPVQAPDQEPAAEAQAPVQAPAAAVQAPVQAPAKTRKRKPPERNDRAKPKKPVRIPVAPNPPGPFTFNSKHDSPTLSKILEQLGKPFVRKQHASTHPYFPRGSLLVKPCKTMDDVWEKHFPPGGLDVYWSRKWDGQSAYLVFCKVYPYVTAYSCSGIRLDLVRIIDALRATCVPALDDGEVIIVKAEMCTEVTTPDEVHETGHAHVHSKQEPYRKAENCTALLVFHCFEVVLITKGARDFQTTLSYLCDFEGEALYSHDLSPMQHTTLLKRLLKNPMRPNPFVRVCEWESFRAHTLEDLAAQQARLSTRIRENAWEGVVFWAAFGKLEANRCHLYISDGTNIRRNRMQFKWKDLIRPFFRLRCEDGGVRMVCPWTDKSLHKVDSGDPQQVHPSYRQDLFAHAAANTVLRAPAIKITPKGKLQGVLQLSRSNVEVVPDFKPDRFEQVENTPHEAACQRLHAIVEANEEKKLVEKPVSGLQRRTAKVYEKAFKSENPADHFC